MSKPSTPSIKALSIIEAQANVSALTELLHACVLDGASIGFVLPFSYEESTNFWRERVFPSLKSGKRFLLVAYEGPDMAGTVQLDIDTLPNQPHRGDVAKLLVHPHHRRKGIAKALMAELELRAQAIGRTLLTLDTRTGDTAEPLYRSLGYQTAGKIPGYCIDAKSGQLDATTLMYKTLNQ